MCHFKNSMTTPQLQKYLGMAVDLVYYHHNRLHQEQTFPDYYWEHLVQMSSLYYLTEMMYCLEYALTQNDYCLSLVISPMKKRYIEADIRLFFEKLYAYLRENLRHN